MKIQKGSSSKTNPSLGEAIPMPSQAHLYNIPVQKAEPLGCLALRTKTVTQPVLVPSLTTHSLFQEGQFSMAIHHPSDVNVCPTLTFDKLLKTKFVKF